MLRIQKVLSFLVLDIDKFLGFLFLCMNVRNRLWFRMRPPSVTICWLVLYALIDFHQKGKSYLNHMSNSFG